MAFYYDGEDDYYGGYSEDSSSDEDYDNGGFCLGCKWRGKRFGDYCDVCDKFIDDEMVWRCPQGYDQVIPFPLGEETAWLCKYCRYEHTQWKPVNPAASKARRNQARVVRVVNATCVDTLSGRTSFKHYLTHYNNCKRFPSRQEVRDAMIQLAAYVSEGIAAPIFDILTAPGKDVEHLYTSGFKIGTQCFHTFINKVLHEECNHKIMDCLMPFIRRMNSRIVSRPYQQQQMVVYRKQNFGPKTLAKLESLRPPRSVRLPGYLSTSLKEDLHNFDGNARLIIRLFWGCPNAYYLASSSAYPSEAEVLFPPYSAFIITKTQSQGGILQVFMDAQDNRAVPNYFDSIYIK
jgi:hypothetical protein